MRTTCKGLWVITEVCKAAQQQSTTWKSLAKPSQIGWLQTHISNRQIFVNFAKIPVNYSSILEVEGAWRYWEIFVIFRATEHILLKKKLDH